MLPVFNVDRDVNNPGNYNIAFPVASVVAPGCCLRDWSGCRDWGCRSSWCCGGPRSRWAELDSFIDLDGPNDGGDSHKESGCQFQEQQ